MSFKRVVKGIGKGSLFGPGRAFGVHKLWDNDLGKAKDPFISIGVLAKLSHTDSKQVRTAIIRNMADRIDDIKPDQLNGFDKSLLKELLKNESVRASAPYPVVAKLISLTTHRTTKSRLVEKIKNYIMWYQNEYETDFSEKDIEAAHSLIHDMHSFARHMVLTELGRIDPALYLLLRKQLDGSA